VAIGNVVPPLVEFVCAALNLIVERKIKNVIFIDGGRVFGSHGKHLLLRW
jgi:hypothetical protein